MTVEKNRNKRGSSCDEQIIPTSVLEKFANVNLLLLGKMSSFVMLV